jgi:hypothetical protein
MGRVAYVLDLMLQAREGEASTVASKADRNGRLG